MDTSRKIMEDLDNGAVTWRTLNRPQRRAALAAALARLAQDHDVMDGATWDDIRPEWAPKTCSIHASIGVSLGALIKAAGMRTRKASTPTCDCGRPWTHLQDIVVLNGNGNETRERLPLCDTCYADFLAMERLYA